MNIIHCEYHMFDQYQSFYHIDGDRSQVYRSDSDHILNDMVAYAVAENISKIQVKCPMRYKEKIQKELTYQLQCYNATHNIEIEVY